MRVFKRTLAALLIVCSVFSFFGCNREQQTVQVTPLCTEFCEAVKAADTAKLITYFDSSVTEDKLKSIIVPKDANEELEFYLETIRESVSYNVQEPVYDKESKTATVFLSWQIADYTSEAFLSATSFSKLREAIAETPPKIITVSVNVDCSGETPRIVNPMDVLEAVYAYTAEETNIMPGTLKDYYQSEKWVLNPKGEYSNTYEIGVKVTFKDDLSSFRFVPGIRYTVLKGEEELFKSNALDLENGSAQLMYTPEAGDKVLNEDGFISEGEYKFVLTDEHGNEIKVLTCDVKTKTLEKEEISFKNNKKDYYLSNLVFDYKDDNLMTNSYVFKSGWWDYEGTSVGKSAFGSNTKTLGFSIAVNKDYKTELYYDYYYSKDSDFKNINKATPLYSASCKPTEYDDQSCYDLDYKADKFEPGFYGLVVYSDASKRHIVLTAACIVVKENSKDVLGQ